VLDQRELPLEVDVAAALLVHRVDGAADPAERDLAARVIEAARPQHEHRAVDEVRVALAVAVARRVGEQLRIDERLHEPVLDPAGAQRAEHVVLADRHRGVVIGVLAEEAHALVDDAGRDRGAVREQEDDELDRVLPPRGGLRRDRFVAVLERVLGERLVRREERRPLDVRAALRLRELLDLLAVGGHEDVGHLARVLRGEDRVERERPSEDRTDVLVLHAAALAADDQCGDHVRVSLRGSSYARSAAPRSDS
jgi:hypothetical protein